jgi:tetratricopeptide (TPR) repeat protein
MRFVLAVVIVLNVTAASAQDAKESVPPTVRTPASELDRTIYELQVSPAGEPRPAMKYRLLPNPADLKPGNAATQYYKAFVLDGPSPLSRPAFVKLQEFVGMRVREINQAELETLLRQLRERDFEESIRAATFREDCDWQLPLREKGVVVTLPSLSVSRNLARYLFVKGKLEIAQGDYPAAFEAARDVFTLAYHMQENGQLVLQGITGISIVGAMHDEFFIDWIEAPNAPNLYWALADVPPFFNMRTIAAHELRMAEYTLHGLEELDERVFSVEEANDLAQRAVSVNYNRSLQDQDVEPRVKLATWALQAYGEGYRELSESGVSHEMLDQMPVSQVALLARWRRFQAARDDLYKWWLLMYGNDSELALKRYDAVSRRDETRRLVAPFDEFLPYFGHLYRAQLRQHRFLSVLRAIEALRLYAARHGDFPDALTDIREVPVPNDPVTNAPFVYRGGGKTATLTMARHNLGADMEYEYRLRLREGNEGK